MTDNKPKVDVNNIDDKQGYINKRTLDITQDRKDQILSIIQDPEAYGKSVLDVSELQKELDDIEKTNKTGNIERKKAPKDYRPEKLDEFKEKDIIDYMFNEWYMAALNWGLSKAVGALEIGVVRTWEAIDASIEKNTNETSANKSNTPQGRLAENLNQYIKKEKEDIKKSHKLDAPALGAMVKVLDKAEADRTPEEAESLKLLPDYFIEKYQKSIKDAETAGTPLADGQKGFLLNNMLTISALRKTMVLDATAAKMLKKNSLGSKEYDNLDFINNKEGVDKLFEFESIPIQQGLYNKVTKDPSILIAKGDNLSGYEELSYNASKAFDDEYEKSKGSVRVFKNNFDKFSKKIGIEDWQVKAEVELENTESIIDASGEHTGFKKETNHERKSKLKEIKERILNKRTKGKEFNVQDYIKDKRSRT